MARKTIKFKYSMQEFEKKANAIVNRTDKEIKDIVVNSSTEFAKKAAKNTPPNWGRNVIDKKYYTRPYLLLIKLIRGAYKGYYATEQDKVQFKNKMKYKVLYTKKGIKKGTVFGYCKTKSQAKKMSKIANRGLARVLWGKSLPEIGAKIPNNIIRLMKKSPNMTTKKLSDAKYKKDTGHTVIIENSFENITSFGHLSQKAGLKAANSYINKRLKMIVDNPQGV